MKKKPLFCFLASGFEVCVNRDFIIVDIMLSFNLLIIGSKKKIEKLICILSKKLK